MDADKQATKLSNHVLRDQTDNGRAKQADQQSDVEPSTVPKDGVDRPTPDPKDTERKMQTFGAAGVAAALLSTPH